MIKAEHLRIGDRLKDKNGNIFRVCEIDSKDDDLPIRIELIHGELPGDYTECWVGPEKNGLDAGDLILGNFMRLLNLYEPVHDAEGNIYCIIKGGIDSYSANLVKASNLHAPQEISFELGSKQYKPLFEDFEDVVKFNIKSCQIGDFVGDMFGNRYFVLDLDPQDSVYPIQLLPFHVENNKVHSRDKGNKFKVELLKPIWVKTSDSDVSLVLTTDKLIKLEDEPQDKFGVLLGAIELKNNQAGWEN